MDYDECVSRLAEEYPAAAKYVEAVTHKASTCDADWFVLEAAGKMLADKDSEIHSELMEMRATALRTSEMVNWENDAAYKHMVVLIDEIAAKYIPAQPTEVE